MLQGRWTNETIDKWFKQLEHGEVQFQEGVAWELLELIEKLDSDIDQVRYYRAKLKSLLANARFERIQKIDHLVERWVREALEDDQENALAHQLNVKLFLGFLDQIPVPEKFPPIRETDHGSAKKKTATEYEHVANKFFRFVDEFESHKSSVGKSFHYIDDAQKEKVQQLISFVEELQKPFQLILSATSEYSNSVTGVYHSASQFTQIVNATKQIEQVTEKWIQLSPAKKGERVKTALDELNNMVGLADVKERVKQLYHFLHYEKERVKQGFHSKDGMNLHMIFTGNPGTGKTHLARLMAKIYFELGLLEHDEVYEVDRTQLVGSYVGQTEENTNKAIERAVGGVLFIDEAYSLKRAGAAGNDYGQTVIDTLVSAMTSGKFAGSFAVILAGYPEEMRTFLRSNPGLRSRFPEQNHIEIENYSVDELIEIGEKVALENDYLLTSGAKNECRKRIERAQVDEAFGNARAVKNIILDAIFQKGSNTLLEKAQTEDFVLLQAGDFKEESNGEEEQQASTELNQLIGLKQVKKEMIQLTSFVKIQQLRREKDMKALPLQVHSVFTGNPGTGKTTVAKLYAKSLKEIGLLKRGHLVVVSRADLVAGYVGQTAQKTKEKIKDALGGVLFIDEAYSLLAKGQSDFGKEVINTLVQEMTEHEENLVVVLAGYSKEMEQLLDSNPGLRSRFKKHIHFHDYSKAELVQIIERRAGTAGYHLSEEAKETLRSQLPEQGHPSNGRFAMDLFDQLVQVQSLRLVQLSNVEMEQLAIIEKEDVKKVVQKDE
ncbi:AAA family ATPase [Alkalihalobacillus sp. MEB130]|uniref:AAA family ATPase n=1 Tax=Alkalihalobacillus sp. MEB130 TaxID=2976704 RepID=UPI0028DF8151|nr:AAA family ATPase [Alkalihalobacillus sp. MEB130]MDT8860576.1 AAA family ATPase [Alkalihalobacillus sp. MEB130]